MKYFNYILIVLILSSCASMKERKGNRMSRKLIEMQDNHISKERKFMAKMRRKGFDVVELLRVNEKIVTDTVIREKFIPFEVQGDTVEVEIRLTCDSLGNVIAELQNKITKQNRTSVEYKVVDNVVYVQGGCESVSDSLKIANNTIINISKENSLLQQRNITLTESERYAKRTVYSLMWLIVIVIAIWVGSNIYKNIKN